MVKGELVFEYGGEWIHATDSYAEEWRIKDVCWIPPVEAFHLQLIINRQAEKN